MRLLASIASLLFVSVHLCQSEEIEVRPNIRVWVQYVALPHETLTELLSGDALGGNALPRKLMELRKDGKAEILETNMVSAQHADKATVESVCEEIWPTEYDPPELAHGFTGLDENGNFKRAGGAVMYDTAVSIRGINATAFETRNVGTTLEIEPMLQKGGHVGLMLVPEMVQRMRYVSWFECEDAWGVVRTTFPIYESWRTIQAVTLKSGSFSLLGSISPKRDLKLPFEDPRVLIFVRADLVPSEP